MTYRIDPSLKVPPPELPKGRGRECRESAKDLLQCLDVPVEGVKRVRLERVTLDIDLDADCDDDK